jgi:hypothetical protein
MEKTVETKDQVEEVKLTPQEQLEELIKTRTGEFEIQISYKDLKYIKNTLTQKLEWTGSNEAYLLIITQLAIDACLEDMDPRNELARVKTQLPSSAIETINYFFSKVTGKGIDSAQKLFAAAMQIRPALEAMKKLDEAIQSLREEIQANAK